MPETIPDRLPHLDPDRLRECLADADLRVLLMCLYHASGDRQWFGPRYRPKRDVRLISEEASGLDPEVQQEIRDAAWACFTGRAGQPPAIGDPGDDGVLEMMRICMSENIAAEYAPMMREEMGLVDRDVQHSSAAPESGNAQNSASAHDSTRPPGTHTGSGWSKAPVLIVGAGASGIILGARLNRLGIPYLIVERHAEVGGTWLENRYPGCGVDTPNHAYSFSIGKRYRWSAYFSPRDDLLAYMKGAADEFDVRRHVRFNTTVTGARWDDERQLWLVSVRPTNAARPDESATESVAETTIETPVLVSAIGQFGLPYKPDITGASDFERTSFHTTDWPEDLDLAGKRVAIIGTGASAMQIVPTIAPQVASLTIYQRSPQWARPIPRYHDALTPNAQWLLEHLPFYAAWFRFSMLWRYGDGLLPFLKKDPAWPHPERSLNRVNDNHRQQMHDHIVAELGERTNLLAKCVPDYPPYGKRILLDNGWFRTLKRPNVELVTERIERVTRRGVTTVDGLEREADVLVWSTGFRMTQMTARLNVRGRGGRKLEDVWGDDNATAHLGICVPGFPNLFITQGPNTGLGHGGSAIFQAECQARYISAALVRMVDDNLPVLEVRQDVHDAFVARTDALHAQMIWTHPKVGTYYRNRHGRVVSATPYSLLEYWQMTRDVKLDEFVS